MTLTKQQIQPARRRRNARAEIRTAFTFKRDGISIARSNHMIGKIGGNSTDGVADLACTVIAYAVMDAVGVNDYKTRQYQDVGSYYGQIRNARKWLRDTATSSEPGTFGWWCAVAGMNPHAILCRVDEEAERDVA